MVFTEKKERAICKTELSSFQENTTFYTHLQKKPPKQNKKTTNQTKQQKTNKKPKKPTKTPNQKPQTKKLEKR